MKYGFIKVASAIPSVKVGDVVFNAQQIEDLIAQAEGKGVEIITFPELSITGYSCQDLFRQQMLLETSEQAVMMLLDFTRKLDIISIVVHRLWLATCCSTVVSSSSTDRYWVLCLRPICLTTASSTRSAGLPLRRPERLRNPLCRTQGETDSGCADIPDLRRRAVWRGDL